MPALGGLSNSGVSHLLGNSSRSGMVRPFTFASYDVQVERIWRELLPVVLGISKPLATLTRWPRWGQGCDVLPLPNSPQDGRVT